MPKLPKPDRRVILISLAITLVIFALFSLVVPISNKTAYRESRCASRQPFACGINCPGYDLNNLDSAQYHIFLGNLETFQKLEPITEPGQCGIPVKAELYL